MTSLCFVQCSWVKFTNNYRVLLYSSFPKMRVQKCSEMTSLILPPQDGERRTAPRRRWRRPLGVSRRDPQFLWTMAPRPGANPWTPADPPGRTLVVTKRAPEPVAGGTPPWASSQHTRLVSLVFIVPSSWTA